MSNPLAKDDATPVKQISMAQAHEIILENMFYKYQGARPELEDRLRSAYQKRFGSEMMDMLGTDEVRPVYLEGKPGCGKTATHESAAKEFSKLMDMRFIKNPSLQMVSSGDIGMNDFVYTVIELAGETSNKEVAGLMTKMKVEMPDGTKTEFMGHIQDWRLAATSMSGYGYANWDDFVAASHQVQNSMLGMLLNGKSSNTSNGVSINDLITADKSIAENGDQIFKLNPEKAMKVRQNSSSVAMGLCGNRGANDGNTVYDMGTAIANRVMRFDVYDTLELFKERTFKSKNDSLSDAGIIGFLEANKDHFLKLAMRENGMMGQSATSRSWDATMTQARMIFSRNGGLSGVANMGEEGQMKVLNDLMTRAAGSVGIETESKFGAYYTELFVGAAPLAEEIIKKGVVNEKKIAEKYSNGAGASGINFGYAFASSIATFAATEVSHILKSKKDTDQLADMESPTAKKFRETMCRFSYGLNQLSQGSLRSYALNQLTTRMKAIAPDLFNDNGTYKIPTPQAAVCMARGMLIDNVKHANSAYQKDIVSTLTQQGGFESAVDFVKGKDMVLTGKKAP